MPRILASSKAFLQPVKNPFLGRAVQFPQLPLSDIADSNRPRQALSLTA